MRSGVFVDAGDEDKGKDVGQTLQLVGEQRRDILANRADILPPRILISRCPLLLRMGFAHVVVRLCASASRHLPRTARVRALEDVRTNSGTRLAMKKVRMS